jgi:hypothetical protein
MARLPLRNLRVMVYAPGSRRAAWITSELTNTEADVDVAADVREVFAALIDAPLPRPAVLVLDFEHMHPADILELHMLRERGWCGIVIGIGAVSRPLRSSLGIERIVDAETGSLAGSIGALGFTDQTMRIPLRARTALVIGRTR